MHDRAGCRTANYARFVRVALLAIALAACGGSAEALPPGADAAQSFRPVSALFFLPDKQPTVARPTSLVPDSKIAWDLRVTAKTLGLEHVTIEVLDQVAYIGGRVDDEEARALLLDAARRTRGVKSVSASLEVGP